MCSHTQFCFSLLAGLDYKNPYFASAPGWPCVVSGLCSWKDPVFLCREAGYGDHGSSPAPLQQECKHSAIKAPLSLFTHIHVYLPLQRESKQPPPSILAPLLAQSPASVQSQSTRLTQHVWIWVRNTIYLASTNAVLYCYKMKCFFNARGGGGRCWVGVVKVLDKINHHYYNNNNN